MTTSSTLKNDNIKYFKNYNIQDLKNDNIYPTYNILFTKKL